MTALARPERSTWLLALAVLAAAGIALRLPFLNHPLIDHDEQFYLLVGARMWQGALPYVDIWDRKPFGLFLLFAAMAGPSGNLVLHYQLAAAACAIATAAMIALIARPFASGFAAVAGGVAYLIWLDLLGGAGGQAPVYYNLLTAIAAACVLRVLSEANGGGRLRFALLAMGAMGVAIQLKPTVVFEGVLFGLALLAAKWRHDRDWKALAGFAAILVLTALAPTLLAFAYFAAIGEGQAFWFANFVSIFTRPVAPHAPIWANLALRMLILGPLIVAAGLGLAIRLKSRSPEFIFLALWTATSLVGLFAIKPFYNHYALPVLLPLSISATLAMSRSRLWAVGITSAGLLWLNLSGFFTDYRTHAEGARSSVAAASQTIKRHLNGGCLWLYSGPTILYQSTSACMVTRYAFPIHLNYVGEDGAIGVDTAAEVTRIFAQKPAVVATNGDRDANGVGFHDRNPRTWALVKANLARDYVEVGQHDIFGSRLHIYALRAR